MLTKNYISDAYFRQAYYSNVALFDYPIDDLILASTFSSYSSGVPRVWINTDAYPPVGHMLYDPAGDSKFDTTTFSSANFNSGYFNCGPGNAYLRFFWNASESQSEFGIGFFYKISASTSGTLLTYGPQGAPYLKITWFTQPTDPLEVFTVEFGTGEPESFSVPVSGDHGSGYLFISVGQQYAGGNVCKLSVIKNDIRYSKTILTSSSFMSSGDRELIIGGEFVDSSYVSSTVTVGNVKYFDYVRDLNVPATNAAQVQNCLFPTGINGASDFCLVCASGFYEKDTQCVATGGPNPFGSTCNASDLQFPSPSGCYTCGNGIYETTENCDDNNTIPYDGCSPICRYEPYSNSYYENGKQMYTCAPYFSYTYWSNNYATVAVQFSRPLLYVGPDTSPNCDSYFESGVNLLGTNPSCSLSSYQVIINFGSNPTFDHAQDTLLVKSGIFAAAGNTYPCTQLLTAESMRTVRSYVYIYPYFDIEQAALDFSVCGTYTLKAVNQTNALGRPIKYTWQISSSYSITTEDRTALDALQATFTDLATITFQPGDLSPSYPQYQITCIAKNWLGYTSADSVYINTQAFTLSPTLTLTTGTPSPGIAF